MRFDRDRAILLGIAALYGLTHEASDGPLPPSLTLRALLALLYGWSNGDTKPYRAFWQVVREPHEGISTAGYLRSTYARTHWNGIVRTLGLEPASMELHDAIARLLRPADMALAAAVRDEVYRHEVIATKGHPHSARGREMAEGIIAAALGKGDGR